MSKKPSRITFQKRMEYLITSIRQDIASGNLKNGAFLPSLNQLTETYELSKNSIQKALKVLEDEQLIEKIPRVGIRVLGNNKKAIIRFGYYPSLEKTAYLRKLIMQYEKKNPNIRVELIPLQYENYQEVVTHYLTAGMLDVVSISDINFHQMTQTVEQAESLFEEQNHNPEVYSFLYKSYTKNEKIYAVPFIFSPVILCYHKEHFTKHESMTLEKPMKWQAFIDLLHQKNNLRTNKLPFYFNPTSNNRWPVFLLQSGLTDSDNKIDALLEDDTLLRKAVQTSYHLIHNQNILSTQFASDDIKVEEMFLTGKISVIMTTYFGLNDLVEKGISYEIVPLPFVEIPATLLVTVGIALNKHSNQKTFSKDFIDYLSSYEAQCSIKKNTLSIPALKEVTKYKTADNIIRPDNFQMYENMIPEFKLLIDLNVRQDQRIKLLNCLKLYWMGFESEEATLSAIKEIINT